MMFREYAFRSRFGVTHEQYLDEPSEVIDWLVSIDATVKGVERG